MSKYNFDELINRKGTNSVKWDLTEPRFGEKNLLPLWVADMDFKSPPAILEAIIKRAEHGVFGYTFPPEEYYNSIINWLKAQHRWEVQKEEVSYIPGVVKGIAFAIDAFTKKGDKIIIQPPVYHPFRLITKAHERIVVNNPLILEDGKYKMDFDGLRNLIDDDCKMLILSNPHNPGGRVWTSSELSELSEICHERNILVISDEIHSDLALSGNTHVPFASVSEDAAQNCITFMAPSKTFNIAGLVSSFSVIKNKDLQAKYIKFLHKSELTQGTIFAYESTVAAYNYGGNWLKELKDYLWQNMQFVERFFAENIPQIKPMIPEASFLIWLDCRELNLSQKELISLFVNKAHLALNDGSMFGEEGTGFMRLNVGCPKSILEKALMQLKESFD